MQPNIHWHGLTKQVINEGLSSRRQPEPIPPHERGRVGDGSFRTRKFKKVFAYIHWALFFGNGSLKRFCFYCTRLCFPEPEMYKVFL